MKYTSNLNLKKPDGTDIVNINDLNENMDVLDTELARKQDKVAGKGLSTEDFTAAEKNKLAGIAAGAQVNRAIATKAQAEAGTDDTTDMTPLRVKEAIDKFLVYR